MLLHKIELTVDGRVLIELSAESAEEMVKASTLSTLVGERVAVDVAKSSEPPSV